MLTVNEYFEGNVKSIGCNNSDGELTVGVMAEGDYVFSTSKKEFMTVVSGKLDVILPGETEIKKISKNEQFIVPANEKFSVKALETTIYTCKYE
ncbi:MAG: pyrimidine/purine nucleoside phosphorylase [Proteocatella sp.]